jgi:DNA-binding MarR family transcriptional regulator
VPLELEDDEKKLLKGLSEVLEDFTMKRGNIPTLQIVMLLKLASEEGKSQRYYAEKWGIPPSTVSRAMLDLGKKTRAGEPGLGLIEEKVSAHSLREHEVYISLTGKTMLRKIAKKLSK